MEYYGSYVKKSKKYRIKIKKYFMKHLCRGEGGKLAREAR